MDTKPCKLYTHVVAKLPHVGKEKLTPSPLVSIFSHPRSTHMQYDPQETTKYDNVTSHSLAVCTVYVKKWYSVLNKQLYKNRLLYHFCVWKIITLPGMSICFCTLSFFCGFAINSTPSLLIPSMLFLKPVTSTAN
jgi:hypothetical protein